MATEPMPTPMPEVEAQAKISSVGRLFGVLFSPKPTFEDIVRKPTWLLPVILLAVLSLVVAFGINQKMNWREYMSQQIEKNPAAAQLSNEQKEQRIEATVKYAPMFAYLFGIPAPVVVVLVVALILWGAYNLLGGANLNYKTALGIVSYAYVPVLIGNLLFIIVLFLKPYGTLDLDNPVATNLAAFLPEDSAKWLMALGKNIDIFVLWITVLMAVGFGAANPKKLKGGKPYSIAFGMLALWVIIRVGAAFIFS
jgi:Yip1 domain